MSVVVVPPGNPKPNLQPGQSWFAAANNSEWAATQLREGQRCWYRRRQGRFGAGSIGPWQEGIFVSSYLYDGVHARIRIPDPDDLIEFTLFPACGDILSATAPEVTR